MISEAQIRQKLEAIFQARFNLNLHDFGDSIWEEELLGKKVGLNGSELVYLFFDLEKEYGITFTQSDIVNGGFRRLQGISGLVLKRLKESGAA